MVDYIILNLHFSHASSTSSPTVPQLVGLPLSDSSPATTTVLWAVPAPALPGGLFPGAPVSLHRGGRGTMPRYPARQCVGPRYPGGRGFLPAPHAFAATEVGATGTRAGEERVQSTQREVDWEREWDREHGSGRARDCGEGYVVCSATGFSGCAAESHQGGLCSGRGGCAGSSSSWRGCGGRRAGQRCGGFEGPVSFASG
mmetsp:Transcript_11867/g.26019  ORF Transcript_11867/g.26019 Transcript_11867/m.26019 type:complete len:200 (-) Transcript_11867:214-813(-)